MQRLPLSIVLTGSVHGIGKKTTIFLLAKPEYRRIGKTDTSDAKLSNCTFLCHTPDCTSMNKYILQEVNSFYSIYFDLLTVASQLSSFGISSIPNYLFTLDYGDYPDLHCS